MGEKRFTIVYEKLSEAASDGDILEEIEEIKAESQEIAELRELLTELESREETTYTSS